MAVPAHDKRDFEFAKQFGLTIRPVVVPNANDRFEWLLSKMQDNNFLEPFCDDGVSVNSRNPDGSLDLNDHPTAEAKNLIVEWLEKHNKGRGRVNYKLRDWLFSRQRYWGEPFPLIHKVDEKRIPTGKVYPVIEELLPLRLPEIQDYQPTGQPEPLLEKATDWVYIQNEDRIAFKRETNTMPQWAGSCWYYLRYIDPKNAQEFAAKKNLDHWLPVDLYVGGAEHAVLHLLYARFWHKVLFDRGYLSCPEPFQRLVNQGMILGEYEYHVEKEKIAGQDAKLAMLGVEVVHRPGKDGEDEAHVLKSRSSDGSRQVNLPDELVEKRKGKMYLKGTEIEITGRADKMSKSRGNVVNPDDVVAEYGADSLRLYEMFMGPLEATKPWNMKGVEGVYRFLSRVWRLVIDETSESLSLHPGVNDQEPDRDTLRKLHQTIQKVTEDTEGLRFNTAIAAMMEFTNHLTKQEVRSRKVLEPFVLLLAPYAPHLAEELWSALGHPSTLAYEPWPGFDPALTQEDSIEVPVQVNGKLRARLSVPADIDATALEIAARNDAQVMAAIAGKEIKKAIVVPKKLVNFVVG